MDAIHQAGINLILYLQGLGAWLYIPFRYTSYLVEDLFIILVVTILYWGVNARLGLRLAIYMMISLSINPLIKLLLHGPRPFWYSPQVKAYILEGSFGIPSNHAQSAVVFFGTLAAWIHKTWAWVVAILLMLLIGMSRMYLGVHFPTDVLAGWLVGAVLLWAMLRLEKPTLEWLFRMQVWQQVLAVFAATLSFILLGVLINLALANWQLPAAWVENFARSFPEETLHPQSYKAVVGFSAALFGLAAGAIWTRSRGGFDAGGAVWRRIVRILIGLVGLAIFYVGLDMLFPVDDSFAAYLLRYLRYALVGFWVTGLAPLIFIKTNLARASQGG